MAFYLRYNTVDFHCNKFFLFNTEKGDYAISMISKNANTTIGVLGCMRRGINLFDKGETLKTFEYTHLSLLGDRVSKWNTINNELTKYEDIDRDKYTTVMIYRDPIERLISAKNVIADDMPYDKYWAKIIETFDTIDTNYINNHLLPQNTFIGKSEIDLYVRMEDVSDFLKSIGIEPIEINKSKPGKKPLSIPNDVLEKLIDIYSVDYELLDKINNSGRVWKKENS